MKQLVHRRNALVKTKSALLQQFHDQIQYDYPSYKKFFTDMECKTSMAFFEQYPSPRTLESTTVEELAEFLRIPSHNACSTKRAEKILDLIEADAVKERNYQSGRDFIVQSMMRNIRYILEELERIDKQQKKLLKEVDYQLETLPGVNTNTVTACALVGQIGDISRFKSANKLANYAGVAPICFSSAGKGKYVQNKNQGNRELYSVLYLLAMQQVHVNAKGQARNPLLRAYFESKVFRGKDKDTGVIMRQLVNIIYSMMKNKTAYRMPEITLRVAGEKEQVIS